MIAEHPVIQVLIPLLGAPLCVLAARGVFAYWVALACSLASLFVATRLLTSVMATGPIVYELGGWAAPWGIEYRIGPLNSFVLLLVALLGALVMLAAKKSVDSEIPRERRHFFYAAMMLCQTGLLGITITGDAFNVFVFLEIAALSSYILIAMGHQRRALYASYQYLIMGTIGSTFILISIGLLYQMTGTLNMADLAARLPAVGDTRTVLISFAFFMVGVSLKMALFPLHMWLPNAYTYAPSAVSAFLAATATKVAVYVMIRFLFSIYGPAFAFEKIDVSQILGALALVGIVLMSAAAIFQTNVKRLLAYSSVAQIGYIVLGISFANVNGLTGGIVHLFNHGLMKGGLFLTVAAVVYRVGSSDLNAFRGLGRSMPITMFLFVLGGLGMIGVPLTVGFISKWYLILAAIETGHWLAVALVLLSSLLAVIYVWRVVEFAYFQPRDRSSDPVGEAPLSMLVPTAILVLATIVFGVSTEWTVGVARAAAVFLLGGHS
ncbi:MAG: monovalent cation/H+ antiporter subunit D family protein [Gemmatimonadetes bacterium]|nr:monovalent cation/H+ antiporter subunit D family protein [Gemmatimonadota bacterium]